MSSVELLPRPAAWSTWLRLARISNTPTVIADAVAGASLAAAGAAGGTVALVALAAALFYTAGMVLNDVLDEGIDRVQRPERPLPRGEVSRRAALGAVVALFAAGQAVLAVAGAAPFLAGFGLVALIVLYDARHKANPLSPLLMGGCRALVYIVAGLAVAASPRAGLWFGAAVMLAYVASLTLVAKAGGGAIVGRLIAGVALLDALMVAVAGGGAVAIAVCLAAFALTIALQTRIAGT